MAKTKTAHPGAPPKGAFRGGEKPEENKVWFQIDPLKQIPFDQFSSEFLRMIVFRTLGKEFSTEQIQSLINRMPVVDGQLTPAKLGKTLGLRSRRRIQIFNSLDINIELKRNYAEHSKADPLQLPAADAVRDKPPERSAIHIFPLKEAVLDCTLSTLIALFIFRVAGEELSPEAVGELIREVEPIPNPNIGKIGEHLGVSLTRLRNMFGHLGIRGDVKLMIKKHRLRAKTEKEIKAFRQRLKKKLG